MASLHRSVWERRLELLTVYGSVIPRAVPFALVGTIQGTFMKAMCFWGYDVFGTDYKETWYHPYPLQIHTMVLGFALVMRLQIAYQRFWEGATQCHQASSKWGDAALQVAATPACLFHAHTSTFDEC